MTLSAIAGGRGRAAWGLSISFPGSTQRLSSEPFTSATGGHYSAKVKSWGSLSYAISDRSGRLPAVDTRVQVWDTDRTINRLVSGVNANSIRGSAATIYLATPTVASSSWLTVFAGKVSKVSFPEPFVAEISLRVDDDQLQRRAGRNLSRVDWPNAKAADVFENPAPVLYGSHDAANTQTGPGLIPTLYVDTILHRYLVCAGKAKTLTRVYVDGVQVSAATYSSAFDYVTKSGRIYTCITFTSDQGDGVVTLDADGYESVGDGSGSVITNPATIWAHRLSNWVFGDYMTGSWLSTSSLIDSTTLSAAESYMTTMGAKGSDYDAERRTGYDITARYCNSWRMLTWWTLSGKIGQGYENPFATPYAGTRWRWYRDEMGPFSLVEDDYSVASRITVRQTPSASDGSFLASFEVMDPSVSSDTPETLDFELSEAK